MLLGDSRRLGCWAGGTSSAPGEHCVNRPTRRADLLAGLTALLLPPRDVKLDRAHDEKLLGERQLLQLQQRLEAHPRNPEARVLARRRSVGHFNVQRDGYKLAQRALKLEGLVPFRIAIRADDLRLLRLLPTGMDHHVSV
eukprot:7167369-Prymnesium_polylepis.2